MHVITRLIVGGAQENTILTCEGMHHRGHDVTLITGPSLGPEGSLMPRAASGGYRVIVEPNLVRNPHPWRDARAYRRLRRLFAELQPAVVHTHSSKAGIIGRAAAWQSKVPLIVHTVHGLPFHPYQSQMTNAAWISLERFAARRCHKIVCVAEAMKRQALACGVGQPEQFITIYSGMEIQPFLHPLTNQTTARKKLGIAFDRIVLGTIARLQPLKGHDDILALAETLIRAEPRLTFLWIGDGIFRNRLAAQIDKAGWRDHFILTGLVAPEQIPNLIPAMDIMVHPSYREGLPRSVVQGMLEQVPAIVYNCDGAGEVCIANETGVLVETGDRPALQAAILQLAQNSGLRDKLGAKAQRLAQERFDADIMVSQLLQLYDQASRSA
ncbi:MAG: glycosyltransferase family 4 protein [Phycisphaerae bacterium]